MSVRLFDFGRQSLASAINWTSDTIKAAQIDMSQSATMCKPITGATNATPIVITATSHGYANGDIVYIRGVGGNLSANGTFQISAVATNTFTITTLKDNLNTTGSAAYTSGGFAINLGASATNLGQYTACRNGTDQTLASLTDTNGVLNAANPTFTAVSGNVDGLILYKFVTNDAGSTPIVWVDGKMQVVVAKDAAATDTTLWVEPLAGPVASGVAFTMSNGVLVTTNASAAQGARSMTILSCPATLPAGHTADVPTTGAGLPFTGGGGSYTYQWDSGPNKIIKI